MTNDIIKNVKRQLKEGDKTIKRHISGKRVVSRIYKKYLQLNKNINDQIKKCAKDFKRYFSIVSLETVSKPINKCSTLLATSEIPNKAPVRYHLWGCCHPVDNKNNW